MKKTMKRILALAIALLLVFPAGLAEEIAQGAQAADATNAQAIFDAEDVEDGGEISSDAVDPEIGEADDAELGGEDDATSDDDGAVTTYWFMVGDALFAEQAVEDGETIVQPDAPEAPEGSVFAGWFTEDGTQLFVGEEEISHADPEQPFVNILARFEAASDEDVKTNAPGGDETTDGEEISDAPVENDTGDTPVEDDGPDEAIPGDDENNPL